MTLDELLAEISPVDEKMRRGAMARWDTIAKPLRSLGILEEIVAQMAAISGSVDIRMGKSAVIVMCADNGVVEEGVTQTVQDVTAIVAENMTRMGTTVCQMAEVAGADVIPVDVGVARPLCAGVLDRCVRRGGTRNMTREPAMTRRECVQAVTIGAELAMECGKKGYGLLAAGEMGIGNTTTASAVVSALLKKQPVDVTGRGAGLTTEGLKRKVRAIETALKIHSLDHSNPLDVLTKVGGLDIAGLVGVFLGGAAVGVPVLVDGFISATAALVASRICPAARDYEIATHVSEEPAGEMLLRELELKPFIRANMRLGEGTGAVAAIPMIKMAVAVYGGMPTFDDINIERYVPLP